MACLAGQIADAVTTELNAESWSQSFTAIRKYRARYALPDLQSLRVAVLLGPASFETLSRGRDDIHYAVDVAILKKINPDDNAQVDPLVELMEQIKDHFRGKGLTADSRAIFCMKREFVSPGEALIDDDHLSDDRTFAGAIRLNWRLLQ